ncbi:MAG: hypothetical protein FJ279_10780, partial [Planctomycetes bacterium]|nr:hypothetical protein [Planctomycetota bacterium]
MIEKCTLLTIVLAAAFVNSIPVLRAEPQRPFTKFTGDQTALRDQLKGVLGMSREQIAQSLGGEKREELRGAVDRLIALSKEAADGKAKAQALAILAAALGDRLQADDQKIRAGITEGGAKDKSNAVWRDTAYDLARYHHLTGDRGAAHRAAVILLRLAEVVKKWPLISREGKAFSQQDKAYLRQWDANGLWGGWYYFDLEGGLPLVRAYDLIHASGAMDELGPGARERIEK